MVIEVNESLCREAETVLEEIVWKCRMPLKFLKQLVETKQLPIAVND